MGQEAQCRARFQGKMSPGKALLETEALIFRGDFRLAIPYKIIESVNANGGEMVVQFGDKTATFELGQLAENWAARLRSPKGLMDKLGVKPRQRVSVLGVADGMFWAEIQSRAADVVKDKLRKESDLIFFGADETRKLDKLTTLQAYLKDAGAIWVVRPKGTKEITERAVMAAGRAAGLVDVKVVRFSATHTAEKFVVPRGRRGARRGSLLK